MIRLTALHILLPKIHFGKFLTSATKLLEYTRVRPLHPQGQRATVSSRNHRGEKGDPPAGGAVAMTAEEPLAESVATFAATVG